MNFFTSPFSGIPLDQQVTNPNIIVGKHSYYSGYYHGHSFDDCVRYLHPERDDVDKLVIGSFCSIGSGAVFMMAGNQGHRSDWISTFPFSIRIMIILQMHAMVLRVQETQLLVMMCGLALRL